MAKEVFLGSVYGTLELRTSDWKKGIREANDELDNLDKSVSSKLTSIGQSLQSTGKALSIGLTAPISAFSGLAIKAGADFDSTMRTIAAVSGAGADEIAKLRDIALDFGKKGLFSTQQVAQAMVDMVRDGLTPAQISGGQLAAAFDLASAAGTDLYETQIALSNAMFNFGADTDQASEFANIFNKLLNATQLELYDVADTMKYIGPIAGTLGISFDDLSTAIGIMGNAGVKASMAGTSLRAGLLRLADPPNEAADALDSLGLSLFDSGGKMLPLPTIISKLNVATKDLTDQQKQAALGAIFGTQAVAGWQTVIEGGLPAWEDMSNKMSSVNDVSEVARIRQEGLHFTLQRLKASLDGFRIAVSDVLEPYLVPLAEKLGQLFDGFSKLNPKVKTMAVVIGGLAAAIGPVMIAVGAFLTFLGGPFLVPLLLAVGAFLSLYQVFKLIGEGVGGGLMETLNAVWTAVKAVGTALINTLKPAFEGLLPVIEQALPYLKYFGLFVGVTLVGLIVGAIAAFAGIVNAFVTFTQGLIQFISGIVQSIQGMFQIIIGIFTLNGEMIKEGWNNLWNGVMNIFKGAFNMIIGWVISFVKSVVMFFVNLYKELVGASIIPDMVNGILSWFSTLFKKGLEIIVNLVSSVVSWFGDMWQKSVDWVTKMFNSVISLFKDTWGGIQGEVSQWPGRLWEWGKNIAQSFVDGFKNVIGGVVDAIKDGLDRARRFLEGHSPPIAGPFKNIDQWGFNIGTSWVEGLMSGISQFSMPSPAFSYAPMANIKSSPIRNITNSPVINVHIGMYAGTEMEKRNIAKEIFDAYDDFQKGTGEGINT